MKIVAVLALLTATMVAGCTSGNTAPTPPQQVGQPQPNSVWEFWIVNNLSVPMKLVYFNSTCMKKGFPETMVVPANSKFGTVLDTDTSGLCYFTESGFTIDYHYNLAPPRLDYTQVKYELPWGANFWDVFGRNQKNVTVIDDESIGAPVQTYCSPGQAAFTAVCGVKQGRP
jgi:hypothetical protein